MKTLEMLVWHGDYRNSEVAIAETIEAGLLALLKTPMGIGYGPKVDSEQFKSLIADLEQGGESQWGWGDYVLK